MSFKVFLEHVLFLCSNWDLNNYEKEDLSPTVVQVSSAHVLGGDYTDLNEMYNALFNAWAGTLVRSRTQPIF